MRVVAALLLISCSVAVWSCGGASPQKAGDMNVSADSTVEGAEADLDRAEASLQRLLGEGSFEDNAKPSDVAASGGDQPAPPPRPSESPAPSKLYRSSEGSCDTACDALASMRRAAERICVLAGSDSPEGGERCDRARTRLAKATQRVQSACPECES